MSTLHAVQADCICPVKLTNQEQGFVADIYFTTDLQYRLKKIRNQIKY